MNCARAKLDIRPDRTGAGLFHARVLGRYTSRESSQSCEIERVALPGVLSGNWKGDLGIEKAPLIGLASGGFFKTIKTAVTRVLENSGSAKALGVCRSGGVVHELPPDPHRLAPGCRETKGHTRSVVAVVKAGPDTYNAQSGTGARLCGSPGTRPNTPALAFE